MKHSTKIALYSTAGGSIGACIGRMIRNGWEPGDVPSYILSFLLHLTVIFPCCWLLLRWMENRKK